MLLWQVGGHTMAWIRNRRESEGVVIGWVAYAIGIVCTGVATGAFIAFPERDLLTIGILFGIPLFLVVVGRGLTLEPFPFGKFRQTG